MKHDVKFFGFLLTLLPIINVITFTVAYSSQKFRISFIQPKNGESLGFSFADFRDKIVVIDIQHNSPVGNSGMVSVGNIILTVQGQDVSNMNAASLSKAIESFKPGERIIFYIERHSLASFSEPKGPLILEGEFVTVLRRANRGYGIHMERQKGNRQIVVKRVIDGSSAHLSKSILPGDLILKVNGLDTVSHSFQDIKNEFTKSQKNSSAFEKRHRIKASFSF